MSAYASNSPKRGPGGAAAPAAPDQRMHRQTAVVLVVDMAESVRLMQTHEASIVRRWSRAVHQVRDVVLPRHRGQLVKSLGDGLLVRFDAVRDAIAAAREIHELLAVDNRGRPEEERIMVRAGLNVTEAWSDGIDIYGAGVNLAARLVTLAGPGETVVSADVRDELAAGLDAACEDLGDCYLKHLDAPVRAYRVGPPGPSHKAARREDGAMMQPTIAVIPFSSRGGDGQLAVGDLIADGVIARLSNSEDLRVVSRLSTNAFRDRSTDLVEVEERLGATYVLSGSYAAMGSKLLVSAELARTGDANVVWADRMNGDIEDLFQAQSALVDSIAQGVNAQIFDIEMNRTIAQPLPTLESYSLLLGSINRMHRSNRDEFEYTGKMLEHLIERHQRVAAPRTWMANWYILRATRGMSSDRERDARAALDMTRRALDSDPYDSLALAVEGFVHCHLFKDLDTAQRRCEEALAANPNQALAWLYKGAVHAFRNEAVEATEATRRAKQLSPLDPQRYYFESLSATAALVARNFSVAERLARTSLRLNRMHSSTWRVLTIALVCQGKMDAASVALSELRRLEPDLTAASYRARMPNGNSMIGQEWAAAMTFAGLPLGI